MKKIIIVLLLISLNSAKAANLKDSLLRLNRQLTELHDRLKNLSHEAAIDIPVIDIRMVNHFIADGTFPTAGKFVLPQPFTDNLADLLTIDLDESTMIIPDNPAVLTDKPLIIIFGEEESPGLPRLKGDLKDIINHKETIKSKFKSTQTLIYVYRIGKSAVQKQPNLDTPGGPPQYLDDILTHISQSFFKTKQQFLGTVSLDFVYFIVDDTGSILRKPNEVETETDKWPETFYKDVNFINTGQARILEGSIKHALRPPA
jgi:hypothetical protein